VDVEVVRADGWAVLAFFLPVFVVVAIYLDFVVDFAEGFLIVLS
jgi:hypothetical protein